MYGCVAECADWDTLELNSLPLLCQINVCLAAAEFILSLPNYVVIM